MTHDEMREEVKRLPQDPDDCWSIPGAKWVSGFRTGLTMAMVLESERMFRESFSRDTALQNVRAGLREATR